MMVTTEYIRAEFEEHGADVIYTGIRKVPLVLQELGGS